MGFFNSLFGRNRAVNQTSASRSKSPQADNRTNPRSHQIPDAIPSRESSAHCGQYEGSRDPERLLTIFRESVQLALKSRNAETAHSRFDLAVEAYYQIRSLLGATGRRDRLDEYMESVAKDFPAQSILNEMGGYVEKAKRMKTTTSQVKYLNLARKTLENGIGERVRGFERLEPSHKAVVAELNRIQELVGDKERFDRPAGGETEYLKAEHSKAEHLAYLL